LGGDAACMADPASGEGIGQAVVSGRIAAFHARQYLEQNDFSAKNMASYAQAMEDKFGRIHKKRSKLADQFSKKTWIMDWIVGFVKWGDWAKRMMNFILIKVST
jgi:menaquinone-9 beta-reductase